MEKHERQKNVGIGSKIKRLERKILLLKNISLADITTSYLSWNLCCSRILWYGFKSLYSISIDTQQENISSKKFFRSVRPEFSFSPFILLFVHLKIIDDFYHFTHLLKWKITESQKFFVRTANIRKKRKLTPEKAFLQKNDKVFWVF